MLCSLTATIVGCSNRWIPNPRTRPGLLVNTPPGVVLETAGRGIPSDVTSPVSGLQGRLGVPQAGRAGPLTRSPASALSGRTVHADRTGASCRAGAEYAARGAEAGPGIARRADLSVTPTDVTQMRPAIRGAVDVREMPSERTITVAGFTATSRQGSNPRSRMWRRCGGMGQVACRPSYG